MSADALVVGEALIDVVIDAGGVTRYPGGSPANVALGLARLGVPTRLHTAIGDDGDGRAIRAHLARSGARLTAESETDAPTSTATATLVDDGSARYEFAVSWDPRPLDALGAPRVIHTGSLGALLEPGCSASSDIVRRGRASGALVTFDPNIRANLVQDAEATRVRAGNLIATSHVAKLSDEDAEFLYPGLSLDDVLDLLIEQGVAVAGITRGSAGAILASGANRVAVPPRSTAVADTVGAGDAFMAALIWALAFRGDGWDGSPVSGSRLAHLGRWAAHAAALTVSRSGADLPTLHELTRDESTER